MTGRQWYRIPELLCRQTLVEMVESGLSAAEIADMLECSLYTVHRAAEVHGVNLNAAKIMGMSNSESRGI